MSLRAVRSPEAPKMTISAGAGLQDFKSFGVARQHRVLDPVVHHLGVVARARRADIGVTVRRRECLKNRLNLFEDRVVAADHQVEADLEAPDAATDAAIEEFHL